jgi:ABC-2 type transport system permease protein
MIQSQIALIKRELLEHRSIFIAPFVIALVVALFAIMGQVTVSGHDQAGKALDIGILAATNLGDKERSAIISGIMVSTSIPLVLTMWILTIFYSLDSLYAERKDRSILFWRSLPLTDAETVFSKLLTALLVIPLITFAVIAVTHLFVLIATSIWLGARGANVWHLIWTAIPFVDNWSATLVFMLALSLWLSPFVGWFLFVSAFTKRSPLLMASLPIAILPILEGIVFKTSVFAEAFFVRSFKIPLLPGWENFYSVFQKGEHLQMIEGASLSLWSLVDLGQFLSSLGLWVGIIVTGLFVAAAIYVRRYRDDS